MNPIKKELNRARGISAGSPRYFFKDFLGKTSRQSLNYRRGFYRRFLSHIFFLNKIYKRRYFSSSKSLFFLDTLLAYKHSFSIFEKFTKFDLFK